MQVLIPEFMSTENADGVEPIPDGLFLFVPADKSGVDLG